MNSSRIAQDQIARHRCLYGITGPFRRTHYVQHTRKQLGPLCPSGMDYARILHHASPWTELAARNSVDLGSASTATALAGAARLAPGAHATPSNTCCSPAF